MAKQKEVSIEVMEISTGRLDFCILGTTPIILNRMSEKVKHELLLPKGRKTAADKAASLKHNPYQEFRDSPYLSEDPQSPTLLCHLAVSFKKAICGAAVDIPGASRAQMGRLIHATGERIALYGLPRLFMSVTRSADMNKTPDVRTRCIVPAWACRLTVSYTKPIIRDQIVINLLAAAGFSQGVGDWRPEKGSGNYGQFELVDEDDPRFISVLKQGRAAQEAAMDSPVPYDRESEEMLEWFSAEAKRRGFEVAA